jgi:hypothetical protein
MKEYEIKKSNIVKIIMEQLKAGKIKTLNELENTVMIEVSKYKAKLIAKAQWERSNVHYARKYENDDRFNGTIFDVFDEVYKKCISKYPKDFLLDLGEMKHICRGRKGKYVTVQDLLPPTIAVAKEKNIINRWNPPDKRYLYLAISTKRDRGELQLQHIERVICEELRAKSAQEVSFIDFDVLSMNKNKRLLNLNYECDTDSEIESFLDRDSATQEEIIKFVGRLFLKLLTNVIFVPIDDSIVSTAEQRDMCYNSFHQLAGLLESYGISGIIYPSTRMSLIGEMGQNLVLFNIDDVTPNSTSIRIKEYKS